MFDRFFRSLFSRRWFWKKRVVSGGPWFTEEDLARFDTAYDEPLTMFDHERVLVEDGEVVGNTAVFNDQGLIERTPCKLPAG